MVGRAGGGSFGVIALLCVGVAGCGGGSASAPSSVATEDATNDATNDATKATDAEPTDGDATTEDAPSSDTATHDGGTEAASDADAIDAGATPKPTGCIDAIATGTHRYTCDGIAYDVTLPVACAAGGCGLVLDVHGMTMSAEMEDANTDMRRLGNEHGYVVVQPNANPAPPSSSWTPGPDDVKVFAFLELALSAYAIDPKRVHMTGFSQGGMMTSRFLCAHADVFASVAPAAGTGCAFFGTAKPSREIDVLYVHGTKDALVAFSEGTSQRDAAIAAWKMKEETVVSSDADHRWTRYRSPAGTVFEFIEHDYAAKSLVLRGHCYPGSDDHAGGAPGQLFGFACEGTNAFTWGEAVMAFFIAHPRK